MTVTVSTAEFDFTIGIVSLDGLLLHEQVVDEHVIGLTDAIEQDGAIRDPVVVDGSTNVVLDGMHRVTAARRLGLEHIPACLVQYDDPGIEVEGWAKVYEGISPGAIERSTAIVGIDLVSSPSTTTGHDEARPVAVIDGTFFQLEAGETIEEVCTFLDTLLGELMSMGYHHRLEPDTYLNGSFDGEETIVAMPPLPKSTIVEVANAPFSFPPNTTRHIVPVRPIGLNVPLDVLRGTANEADTWLAERLAHCDLKYVPPGSIHDDRRYDEALVVVDE